MNSPSSGPESPRHALYLNLARACWMSLFAGFFAKAALHALQKNVGGEAFQLLSAGLIALIMLGGITCGIIALTGIRRHGREGILWPSIIGIGVWVLLIGLAIPVVSRDVALSKAPRLEPMAQSPNAKRIKDGVRGFSFELPEGYKPTDPSELGDGFSHAFIREVPDELRRVLVVKPLHGFITTHERIKPENLPKESKSTVDTFNWRGVTVDGVRMPEEVEGHAYVTWNIQIPLRREAIQISVGGPESAEPEIRRTIDQLLSTLDGRVHPGGERN